MKTLLAVLGLAFFAALPASAQNVRVDGIALTRGGAPAPGANVAICSPQPANTTTMPCTPPASLCLSLADSFCGQPNVVQADGLGNFHFYIASGTVYTRQIYGSGLTTLVTPDQQAGGGGGSSGFACGTTASPGIPFWNGTACLLDTNAQLDGNGNLIATSVIASGNITAAGTVSGNTLATSGTGGILDLQLQTPPTSVPANHAYVYANSITGLLDCLKNGLVECFGGIQSLAIGPVALPTSAIISGACSSVVTLTATGATTSSHIVATAAADPTGVTGYSPSASGSVYVQAYVTANTANFKVCNNTSGTITPGALTLNAVVF